MNIAVEKSEEKIGVLIADADKNTRAYINSSLAKTGVFKVWTAANAEDAIMILREVKAGEISIVIFDISQEGVNGHLLLQKIRTDSRFALIEILMCSDAISVADSFLLKEFDINFFVKRTVSVTDLLSKIQEIVEFQIKMSRKKTLIKELEHAILTRNLTECNNLIKNSELASEILTNKDFVHFRAEIYLLNNDIDIAINLLTNYLKKAPHGEGETFRTLNTLGKALCKANKFDDALVVFEKLAQKSPYNLSHKVAWGDALLDKGDALGAQEKFNQVLEVDPEHKDAKIGVGKTLMAQGNTKDAMSLFTTIQEPIESYSLASYFNNIAVAMVKNKKTDEAIEMYENAIPFFDKYKPSIYFNLGLAWIKRENYMLASKCFDEVLKIGGNDILANKIILQEYKKNGMQFLVKKYGKKLHKISTDLQSE